MQDLTPKWSWKERIVDDLYHCFVANKIILVFEIESETLLCRVKTDIGSTKTIVVNVNEGFVDSSNHSKHDTSSKIRIEHLENGSSSYWIKSMIDNSRN